MDTADLIKDINALRKTTTEADPPKEKTLEEQFAAARAHMQAADEIPEAPKPAPTEASPSKENDNLLNSLFSGAADDVMKKMLTEYFGPKEKLDDGTDNPKRELYERAIRNSGSDFIPAAYALLRAELALNDSTDTKEQDFQPALLNSHPQGNAIASAAYHLEKVERLFANEQHEEGFLEAEETLLSTDVKLYWYRLISLMEVQHRKSSHSGIPGKLGEDVRRCAGLPNVSAKAYRSGIFCSLLFTAAMLFFLWYPPLRDFLVTTIQPDHMLHVCVVIIVILFFLAGWAGAIAGVIVFGLLGAGIEHFFGEAALGTTLIILIYLAGCAILFALAKNTGYSKVKRNKKHKKINKQRAEMRRELEPQLRQRLAKLDHIEQATKLDSNNTPAVLYWTSITKVDTTEELRKSFRNDLSTLRNLYQNALNSL